MPHPFHIHGFQFQVLERRASPEQQKQLAVNAQGLAASDLGGKDTVLVWPGESVCIVIDFSHTFYGNQVYMIHCHNLRHEDHDMMGQFEVIDPDGPGDDPFSAPAQDLADEDYYPL